MFIVKGVIVFDFMLFIWVKIMFDFVCSVYFYYIENLNILYVYGMKNFKMMEIWINKYIYKLKKLK